MGVVTLSTPNCGSLGTGAPTRLPTVARVQHKAVKRMQKFRPKKHNKSDRNHKLAVYPAPPTPPPMFTIVSQPSSSVSTPEAEQK